ncbi:MAG: transcriptional regulator [Altibacter sp.]|uniref:GbsR/MarR family transcriptional regulator n=1 Tax=Altibacter sp. TaxID=2024823 RepID=UPI001E090FE6|nr:transcriptional regulator [Altibacter sp.]MBZ0326532.1 transcriptional regulator [Altibacter sp.]
MNTCSKEKSDLIEEIGLNFENKHHFTPLAGRIYAFMILSDDEGHSFEDFVEITSASKSSVSTNLNLLVQLKYVEFFTKPGDRKRYFRPTKNYLKITLEEYLNTINKELKIVEKINKFNCKYHPQKFTKSESIGLIFQQYLESQKKNLKSTIDKMVSFHKNSTA